MMDGAYFTSRRDIIDFFNDLLQMSLTKIEQTATGAVACQLMEYIFPKSIPMSRVNWEAKMSHEFVGNYKLLQAGELLSVILLSYIEFCLFFWFFVLFLCSYCPI